MYGPGHAELPCGSVFLISRDGEGGGGNINSVFWGKSPLS